MLWCFPNIPEGLKKRACRYLLQRYLGKFLLEKLSLDQLTLDLYEGTGTIANVVLDVKALNEIGESYNLPLEFVDGFVSSISVSVPWSAPIKESSKVQIHGLMLTIQPKKRTRNISTLESLWDSMSTTTSMQLAKDVIEETEEEDEEETLLHETQPTESGQDQIDGLTRFANTIDTVFRRIKVTFTDMVFRVEHTPSDSKVGIAVEFRVNKMEYFDESGLEVEDEQNKEEYQQPSPISVRNFRIEGLSIFTDQFIPGSVWRSTSCSSGMQRTPDLSPNDLHDPVEELVSPEGTPVADSTLSPDESDDSNPILISRMTEPLVLRLSLKQDQSLAGAKIDIELNSGAVPLFLNPSQVHLLWELAKALYLPESRGSGSHGRGQPSEQWNKPMSKADFCLVEQDLQKHLSKPQSNGQSLRQAPHQAWSSHSLDDSEDNFQLARAPQPLCSSNNSSIVNGSYMENSFSSVNTRFSDLSISGDSIFERGSSSSRTGRTIDTIQELLNKDCQVDQSTFRLTLSSLFVVLLHEDVTPVTPTCAPNKDQRRITAEEYFDALHATLSQSRTSLAQLAVSKTKFTQICSLSHIRLLACPLVLEASQKCYANNQILSTVLSVARCEVLECLVEKVANGGLHKSAVDVSYTELLKFASSDRVPTDIAIRLNYEHKERLGQRGRHPHTTITCSLGTFYTEVDISMVDRLQALFRPSCLNHSASQNTDNNSTLPDERTDISISSPSVTIKLRFPVPDLRSVHSLGRVPWWQKSLRKENLILELSQLTLKTSCDSRPLKVELQCKEAHGLMETEGNDSPVPFVCISSDPEEDPNFSERGFDLPRVVFMVNPVANPLEAEALHEEPEDLIHPSTSVHGFEFRRQEPSPFACRRVAYDSNTSHHQHHYDSITPENSDQVVLPADKEHMNEFMEKTLNGSHITLEFNLPSVHVQLPSKEFYEILYNRITTDLLLWTPAAPYAMHTSGEQFDSHNDHLLKESAYFEAFTYCKSGAQNESVSDSEDDGVYQSVPDGRFQSFRYSGRGQSNVSYRVNVIQGIFNFRTPLLDSQSIPVDDFCGEFQVNVENGIIFGVSGHNGDPHVSYTCLTLNSGALFHEGKVSQVLSPKRLQAAYVKGSRKTSHLNRTLYRTGPEVLCSYPSFSAFQGPETSDLFSLVVRAGLDDNRGLKTFKVALGLQEATLRHKVSLRQQSWLTQLLDFFDVANHPVAGYSPPAVVTELHLHLRSCAIDYRPRYLPLRTVATVENFSISSNLAAQSTTSLLRIISEELSLYISNKMDTDVVDLRKNYVCVLDTGLFNFTLRKTDGKDPKVPEVDLKAKNNTVHIHTCADSCRALQDLLKYVVSDGDLMGESTDFFDAQGFPSILESEGTPSYVDRLMEDAMMDLPQETYTSNNDLRSSVTSNTSSQLSQSGSGSESQSKENFFDKNDVYYELDDEDFCILEEDLGTGILPKSGTTQVRMLIDEPIVLLENFFARPIGRQDLLKAPADFPPAIRSYMLREMSLVWHLYGGYDFQQQSQKTEPEKKVRVVIDETQNWRSEYNSPGLNMGIDGLNSVSYKKGSQHESVWGNLHSDQDEVNRHPHLRRAPTPAAENVNRSPKWGGKSRQQDVCVELQMSKVRFQHEEYASHHPQASRQVLLVQEVEIRDRLASSEFNKFLYQFTSETNPRQTHSHMLVIKATHFRTNPKNPSTSECSLRVSVKPLRLNIDQDTLVFLCNFFTELNTQDPCSEMGDVQSQCSVPQDYHKSDYEDEMKGSADDVSESGSRQKSASPIYFRSFVFSPDVLIQLDYQGRRVQMEQGVLQGMLMGLAQLNRSKIMLKRLSYRHGLLGTDRLFAYALHEWLQDIKKNQLPSLLGGVGPISSFVQLFQGVRDLIWFPIEQYRKDGRLMRGLQRGANSFATSTTMAALELTGTLVLLIQGAAEFAYDMVSPGPSVKGAHDRQIMDQPHHYSEPMDIREGVAKAYNVVRQGIGDTARCVVRTATEEHERKGVPGAVGGVLRQIPPIAVKPILLASKATIQVLDGVKYQLAPDARREAVEKWRGRTTH